jgi:hypothetical protein
VLGKIESVLVILAGKKADVDGRHPNQIYQRTRRVLMVQLALSVGVIRWRYLP